jgi:ketopantoate reductase
METARARVAAAMATHERSLDIEGLKFTETTENGLRIFTHTEKDMIVKMFPDKHVEFYNMKGNLLQSDSTLTVEEIFKMRKLATINTVGNIADANNTPIGRNRELAEQAVESLNKRDDIHEVLTKNMSLVFSNAPKHDGPTLWEYFKDKPASEVLKYTDQINGHTDQGSLKNHLQLLMDSVKKATGKELKLTNFWGRSKTVNEVMEKGLEILKSKGRLEDFEIKVKDSVNK